MKKRRKGHEEHHHYNINRQQNDHFIFNNAEDTYHFNSDFMLLNKGNWGERWVIRFSKSWKIIKQLKKNLKIHVFEKQLGKNDYFYVKKCLKWLFLWLRNCSKRLFSTLKPQFDFLKLKSAAGTPDSPGRKRQQSEMRRRLTVFRHNLSIVSF